MGSPLSGRLDEHARISLAMPLCGVRRLRFFLDFRNNRFGPLVSLSLALVFCAQGQHTACDESCGLPAPAGLGSTWWVV